MRRLRAGRDAHWKRRGDDYDALKQRLAARLLAELERQVPAVAGNIAYAELSTPVTTRHFMNYGSGEIYGIAATPERYALRELGAQDADSRAVSDRAGCGQPGSGGRAVRRSGERIGGAGEEPDGRCDEAVAEAGTTTRREARSVVVSQSGVLHGLTVRVLGAMAKSAEHDSMAGDDAARLAAFDQYRSLLFSVAYRMLGSVADAEDMLQETFIRWQQAPEEEIRSPRAFLVTIISRLCINQLQSARVQREEYVGQWLPEPIVTGPGSDPLELVRVDESLSMAFLVLLERLTPVERAVFLLREVFEYEYAEIATVLGESEANCRQILHRASQHVTTLRPRFKATQRQKSELLEGFLSATKSGDLTGWSPCWRVMSCFTRMAVASHWLHLT